MALWLNCHMHIWLAYTLLVRDRKRKKTQLAENRVHMHNNAWHITFLHLLSQFSFQFPLRYHFSYAWILTNFHPITFFFSHYHITGSIYGRLAACCCCWMWKICGPSLQFQHCQKLLTSHQEVCVHSSMNAGQFWAHGSFSWVSLPLPSVRAGLQTWSSWISLQPWKWTALSGKFPLTWLNTVYPSFFFQAVCQTKTLSDLLIQNLHLKVKEPSCAPGQIIMKIPGLTTSS